MIAHLLLAIVAQGGDEIADYFPLKTGTVWTYEAKTAAGKSTVIGRVETETTVNNEKTVPIASYVNGSRVSIAYYKTTAQSVFILATDPSKPLTVPKEVLRVGSTDKWIWDGPEGNAVVHMEAHVTPTGAKNILKRKVDTIKIDFDGTMTAEDKGMMLKFHQVATYAKGIGLIQMDQEWTYDRDKVSQTMKLTKFEQATKQ